MVSKSQANLTNPLMHLSFLVFPVLLINISAKMMTEYSFLCQLSLLGIYLKPIE